MEKKLKLNRTYYIRESSSWLRTLNELRSENIRLKNELSDAIRGNVNLDFVEQAERFQQRFVEKDQVIDLLRHDINTLLYKLSGQEITTADECQCIVLEKDIEQLVGEFHQMQVAFTSFLILGKAG